MSGQININIPPDSREWLFKDDNDRRSDAGRLWSLGRFRPKCKAGDDIIFRFDGEAVAAATVDEVIPPGMFDTTSHHGKRFLRGHKVTWLNSSFIDLLDHRVTVQVDCNNEHGHDTGKVSKVQLAVGNSDDTIDLDGACVSVHWLADTPHPLAVSHKVRLGRRCYAMRCHASHVGNLHWDSFEVSLLDGTAILNQLLDADFGITCGPSVLHDRQFSTDPITWRELLAAVAEIADA